MLVRLINGVVHEPPPIPKDLAMEGVTEGLHDERRGRRLDPRQNGLWLSRLRRQSSMDGLSRYRCRVGHAFKDESLLAGQN